MSSRTNPKLELITLVDLNETLVNAWAREFVDLPSWYPRVETKHANYFDFHADAIVSPANSFGFMDGGIDLAIQLKLNCQSDVQRMINSRFHGEMPVGCAAVVKTKVSRWPLLVVAPTMRIPENVAMTHNAYDAFRAILHAIDASQAYAYDFPTPTSLLCCGLATATGRMVPAVAARQMRYALDAVMRPGIPESIASIHKTHRAMMWTEGRARN